MPMRPPVRAAGAAGAAVAAAGAACVAYGVLVERDWYRLRRETVPALEPGSPPLTVLHLSDLHLTAADGRRAEFLRRLATEPADLVVLTGDMLGEPEALGPVLDALGRFRPALGACAVLGSNDYWAPRFRNWLGYFRGPSTRNRRRATGRNPWRELVAGLEELGWLVLSNRRGRLGDVELAGMDDPHIRRDDPLVAVPPRAGPDEVAERVAEPGRPVVVGAEDRDRAQPRPEPAEGLQHRVERPGLAEHVAGHHHQVDPLAGQTFQERHQPAVGDGEVQVRQVQHGERRLPRGQGLDPLAPQPVPVPLDQDAVADAGGPGRGHRPGQQGDLGRGFGHAVALLGGQLWDERGL